MTLEEQQMLRALIDTYTSLAEQVSFCFSNRLGCLRRNKLGWCKASWENTCMLCFVKLGWYVSQISPSPIPQRWWRLSVHYQITHQWKQMQASWQNPHQALSSKQGHSASRPPHWCVRLSPPLDRLTSSISYPAVLLHTPQLQMKAIGLNNRLLMEEESLAVLWSQKSHSTHHVSCQLINEADALKQP